MRKFFTQAEIDEADTQAIVMVEANNIIVSASLAALHEDFQALDCTPAADPSPPPGDRLNIPNTILRR